jgi:exonuclease VII large subunit
MANAVVLNGRPNNVQMNMGNNMWGFFLSHRGGTVKVNCNDISLYYSSGLNQFSNPVTTNGSSGQSNQEIPITVTVTGIFSNQVCPPILIANKIIPDVDTNSNICKQFQQMKEEWAIPNKNKNKLPLFINTIGIIVPENVHLKDDIIQKIQLSGFNGKLYVYKCCMTGTKGIDEIIMGIKFFENYGNVDVLLILNWCQYYKNQILFSHARVCNALKELKCHRIVAINDDNENNEKMFLSYIADKHFIKPENAIEHLCNIYNAPYKKLFDKIDMFNRKFDQILQNEVTKIQNLKNEILLDTPLNIVNDINNMLSELKNNLFNFVDSEKNKLKRIKYAIESPFNSILLDEFNNVVNNPFLTGYCQLNQLDQLRQLDQTDQTDQSDQLDHMDNTNKKYFLRTYNNELYEIIMCKKIENLSAKNNIYNENDLNKLVVNNSTNHGHGFSN